MGLEWDDRRVGLWWVERRIAEVGKKIVNGMKAVS